MQNSNNIVANTLKVLGIIIGLLGVIAIVFYMSTMSGGITSIVSVAVVFSVLMSCTIAALLLYAFGEAISLLQDIKNNTCNKGAEQVFTSDELPSL
jgi:hypothetical protein